VGLRSRPAARLAVLAAACGLAACGSSSSSTTAATTTGRPVRTTPPAAGTIARRVARPVPTGPQRAPVTILMYHVVTAAPPGTPYPALWVPKALFRAQVQALARAGYHATTLQRVWSAWHGRATMPRHPIVLTFDDGYLTQYTNARPALDALRWPGVLNLEVHNLGAKGLPRHLVARLVQDGWEVDAHTLTHPDLTKVDAARLHAEVAGSRAYLQRAFGIPVDFFCYPAGRFDAAVQAAVRAAGYLGATATTPARATPTGDPYALPRLEVTPSLTPAALLARIRALPTSGRPS
jgi:peptidoglycan/xylan/chitin deacetylase (PgdA/CDA1 family)